jgi:hypothetical protein
MPGNLQAILLSIKLLALIAVFLVSNLIICRRILQSDKLTYDGDGSKMCVHTEFKCIHGAPLVCGILAYESLWGFISGLRNQKLLEQAARADGKMDPDGELDADDDDVERAQDVENNDDEDADDEDDDDDKSEVEDEEINDEDARQGSVQQMGMAQIVIYVEQGGTLHINV